MVLARHAVWVCLAGCSYSPSPGQVPTGDGSPGDGPGDTPGVETDAPGDTAPVPDLIDRGLVLRYFMNEAASGTTPTMLLDSADAPLPLPITFGQATFVEDNGHRGLRFPASQSSGKAEVSIGSSSKLANLMAPARTVTIEVVAQIDNAGAAGGANESQITGMRGGNPDFMLTAIGTTDLRFFRPFGNVGATWNGVHDQQRMVLHLVFDSTQVDSATRIELFKNSALVPKTTSSPPAQGQQVGLGGSDDLVIGNRQQADRSIQGTIFYVAYYNVALSSEEISTNAQHLIVDDDQ